THPQPPARPFRVRGPPRLLRAGRARAHRRARGADPRRAARAGGRRRGGAAGAGHPADRQPAPAPRARLRRGAQRRRGHPGGRARSVDVVRGRRAGARQGRPVDPRCDLPPVRGWPGGPVHPRDQRRRRNRHGGRRVRALPPAARPAQAHPARPSGHARRVRPSRPSPARAAASAVRLNLRSSTVGPDAFDYDLPAAAIAQVPAEPRDAARLLVSLEAGGAAAHLQVADLAELLGPGDLLVLNDTRVLPARLRLRRATGGAVEVLLLEPDDEPRTWTAPVRPGRRLPPGTRVEGPGLAVVIGERIDGGRRRVEVQGSIAEHGVVPLPPYIHATLMDPERYQTVYARRS